MQAALLLAAALCGELVTDPGAPAAGVPTFTFTILDDSLAQPGAVENFTFNLPQPIVEGDLVLLETNDPKVLAMVISDANSGILHPELWSDIVHFRNNGANGGGTANIVSVDNFSAGDLTSNNVLYINEALGRDLEGVGGDFTPYNAGPPTNFNAYLIESTIIPEPSSLILLGLGGLGLLGYGRLRRGRIA